VYRFRSSRDVWVGVVPIVLLLFVVEIAVLAPNQEYPVLGSVAAVLGGIGALLGLWAVANRLRGRPWLARPDRIGPVEVILFVFGPALIPLAFGGQWRSAVVTALVNLAVLGIAYLERRNAVVSLAAWTLRHLGQRLRQVSGVLVRALPLLLLVVVLVFFTAETWQLAHELRWPVLLVSCAVFAAAAVTFASIRAPEQIGALESHDLDWATTRALVAGTPAEPLAPARRRRPMKVPPLSRSERRNVRMVVVVSEMTLVAIVSGGLFLSFLVLGTLTAPPTLVRTWVTEAPHVLFSFDLFGTRLGPTVELVKVATFVAAFAALQFTVSLLSDRAYQDDFLGDLRDSLRRSFAARAVYLHHVLADT